jgi:hypothetical protein
MFPRRRGARALLLFLAEIFCVAAAAQAQQAVTINVDVGANRRPINPLIYGVAHGSVSALQDLNVPLNRLGGNNTSRYNWKLNADNRGNDWFFESIPDKSSVAGERGDTFISNSRAGGAEPALTIPTIGWVAKLGANRNKLASFLVSRYGAQQKTDPWWPDAGNGVRPDGYYITGNDPNDASVQVDSLYQQEWVRHLVSRWGTAGNGGLRYYILDNEPSIWHATHRDVVPIGKTMAEVRNLILDYAAKIKQVDPGAIVIGPEEWGWSGYFFSGYDQQYGNRYGWNQPLPDRTANGNWNYLPWLLDQLRRNHEQTGKRLLDVFSVHYYPQGGEFREDYSTNMQLRRNRSTRSLWDPNYTDESWINAKVRLIPRLREWVDTYYPGTQIAITEYNWGAEKHINGATTQADILGIFGREGLDMAARWTTPEPSTPTYKAIKLYRNYDGNRSTFGDVSVSTSVPNPDSVSAFSAQRTSDNALTIMVINKSLTDAANLTINIANFRSRGIAQAWQLTEANVITQLDDLPVNGSTLASTVPKQSITLFVLPVQTAGTTQVRINCGGARYVSPTTGNVFAADSYFQGGLVTSYSSRDILNTTDDALYLRMRYGTNFGYTIPAENGSYTLRLHFAECYYSAAGQRRFNVTVNGVAVLTNYDIFAAAGGRNRAVTVSIPVAVTNGSVSIRLSTSISGRNALIAGIELAP